MISILKVLMGKKYNIQDPGAALSKDLEHLGFSLQGVPWWQTAWARHAAGEPSRGWVLKATLRGLEFILQAVQKYYRVLSRGMV